MNVSGYQPLKTGTVPWRIHLSPTVKWISHVSYSSVCACFSELRVVAFIGFMVWIPQLKQVNMVTPVMSRTISGMRHESDLNTVSVFDSSNGGKVTWSHQSSYCASSRTAVACLWTLLAAGGGEAVFGCVMLIRGMPAGKYSASLLLHSYNSLVTRSFVTEHTDEYWP